MTNDVLLALSISLVLLLVLLPSALLAGKIVTLYDSIPREVKVRCKLASEVPTVSGKIDWFGLGAMALMCWPSDVLYPYQLLVGFVLFMICSGMCFYHARFYYSIARVQNEVPKSLTVFSRFCLVSLFAGGLLAMMAGGYFVRKFFENFLA